MFAIMYIIVYIKSLKGEEMFTESTPNASRLMHALRSSGYDNIAAVSDLIDNSIDANATKIGISISIPIWNSNKPSIMIADNGQGMSEETLKQAMRLGSKTVHSENSDLGKFGMGLITASISIGKILTVVTKKDGIFLTAKQDLNQIDKTDRFEYELRNSDTDEINFFNQISNDAPSGTIVVISDCDRMQFDSEKKFSDKLTAEVQRIFRKFLLDGTEIIINNRAVVPIDPMFGEDDHTQILKEGTISLEHNGENYEISVRAIIIPDFGPQKNKAFGINQVNQGFYLMRNHREIASGRDLGIFKKHNDFNRLRIEVNFPSAIDDLVGLNFTKREVKPSHIFIDALEKFTEDVFAKARHIVKMPSVPLPPTGKPTPSNVPTNNTPAPVPTPTPTPQSPKPPIITPPAPKSTTLSVDFGFSVFESANAAKIEKIGNKVIVVFNVENDLYKNLIEPARHNEELMQKFNNFIRDIANSINKD